MFSLFLSFPDPEFEKKYQKDCDTVKFMNFHKFIMCELVLGIITLCFQMGYDSVNFTRVLLLLILFLLVIIVYFLDRKLRKWKFLNTFFILLHLNLLFATIELIASTRSTDPTHFPLKVLTYTSPLQVLFCSLLIARIKWVFSIIFSILFQIFFMVRMYTIEDLTISPLISLVHLLCVFVFSLVGYYQESVTRSFYKMINESNQRLVNFEILLKNIIPSPIFILDVENQVSEFVNLSACNFLELQNTSCNKSIYCAVVDLLIKFQPMDLNKNIPDLQKLYNAPLNEFENPLEFLTIEATLQKEVGSISYFHLKFLKLQWNYKNCILLILDDITESHRIKELRNLDEYKNQLLATVSHDLRTPLNGMLGMMELISLNLIEKKDKKNMSIAMASGHLLLNMINDILDFSQIHNKKLRLAFQKIDLIDVLKQASKLIKFQAKSKGLAYELKCGEIDKAIINSDPNRIRQILLNLLNNSLKFTQNGYINLSVKKTFDPDYLGVVYKVKVKDSGIGIKDEDFPKLFKLFGKLDLENPELNRSGVGLGLTISQNLAKMLSPHLNISGIFLKSIFGNGSKFWFYLEGEQNEDNIPPVSPDLPLQNIPYLFINSQDENQIFENKLSFSTISKDKVLLVDDDMVNLMVAKRYCEYFGVDFLTAHNGAEAIDVFDKHINNNEELVIKGIFMDCNMPIMDGFKATKLLLDIMKKNNIGNIPIIGMTANVLHEDLDNCLKCGMQSFLNKPVCRADFGRALAQSFKIKIKQF